MNPEQFVYWLQGYTELTGGKEPTLEQWKMIREHLRTVFLKVTPEFKPEHGLGVDWQEQLRKLYEEFARDRKVEYTDPNLELIC